MPARLFPGFMIYLIPLMNITVVKSNAFKQDSETVLIWKLFICCLVCFYMIIFADINSLIQNHERALCNLSFAYSRQQVRLCHHDQHRKYYLTPHLDVTSIGFACPWYSMLLMPQPFWINSGEELLSVHLSKHNAEIVSDPVWFEIDTL